jgi:hypothetical protein
LKRISEIRRKNAIKASQMTTNSTINSNSLSMSSTLISIQPKNAIHGTLGLFYFIFDFEII